MEHMKGVRHLEIHYNTVNFIYLLLGGTLTRQLLKAHDHAQLPLLRQHSRSRMTDEESSVYSVDEQGFYTSMHKDSGLKR